MSDCAICLRPTVDTGYLCWPDSDDLSKAMAFMVETADELQTVIARLARGAPGVGGHSAESPLPFNDYAAESSWSIRNTLHAWVKHVADTRGIAFPGDGIAAMAQFLGGQVKWLRCQPDAAAAHDELTYAAWLLRSTVDTRPDWLYLGPCHTTTDEGRCDADLRCIKGSITARCKECGARHDVDDRRRWLLRRVHDRLEPVPVLASIISSWGGQRLPENTIKSWVYRRRLTPKGTDPRTRQPLYRLGDALDLVNATTRKP